MLPLLNTHAQFGTKNKIVILEPRAIEVLLIQFCIDTLNKEGNIMSRNPFGKTREVSEPYAIYKNFQGWTWKVVKTYQMPKNEAKNPYARWKVACTSPLSQSDGTVGRDTYARDILSNGYLLEATPEWRDAYGGKQSDSLAELEEVVERILNA